MSMLTLYIYMHICHATMLTVLTIYTCVAGWDLPPGCVCTLPTCHLPTCRHPQDCLPATMHCLYTNIPSPTIYHHAACLPAFLPFLFFPLNMPATIHVCLPCLFAVPLPLLCCYLDWVEERRPSQGLGTCHPPNITFLPLPFNLPPYCCSCFRWDWTGLEPLGQDWDTFTPCASFSACCSGWCFPCLPPLLTWLYSSAFPQHCVQQHRAMPVGSAAFRPTLAQDSMAACQHALVPSPNQQLLPDLQHYSNFCCLLCLLGQPVDFFPNPSPLHCLPMSPLHPSPSMCHNPLPHTGGPYCCSVTPAPPGTATLYPTYFLLPSLPVAQPPSHWLDFPSPTMPFCFGSLALVLYPFCHFAILLPHPFHVYACTCICQTFPPHAHPCLGTSSLLCTTCNCTASLPCPCLFLGLLCLPAMLLYTMTLCMLGGHALCLPAGYLDFIPFSFPCLPPWDMNTLNPAPCGTVALYAFCNSSASPSVIVCLFLCAVSSHMLPHFYTILLLPERDRPSQHWYMP